MFESRRHGNTPSSRHARGAMAERPEIRTSSAAGTAVALISTAARASGRGSKTPLSVSVTRELRSIKMAGPVVPRAAVGLEQEATRVAQSPWVKAARRLRGCGCGRVSVECRARGHDPHSAHVEGLRGRGCVYPRWPGVFPVMAVACVEPLTRYRPREAVCERSVGSVCAWRRRNPGFLRSALCYTLARNRGFLGDFAGLKLPHESLVLILAGTGRRAQL